MAFMTWKENYTTKIASIDEQHKKLIDLLNYFYENIRNKSNKELIGGIISEMKAYTILHFSHEERLFNSYDYPESENHKKEHIEFIKKVNDLEAKINKQQIIISFEVTDFLKKWIKNHILGSDMKYREYLLESGAR